MNNTRSVRLTRIKNLDEKRLDAVTGELKKLNQTLGQRKLIRDQLQQRLHASLTQVTDTTTVAMKNQTVTWATHAQATLATLNDHLRSLNVKRTELLEAVRQQRAKVKGWELLLEKIAAEQLVEAEKQAMYIADDRFLSTTAVQNRSSQ